MKISSFMPSELKGANRPKPRPGITYRWRRREMARLAYRIAKRRKGTAP